MNEKGNNLTIINKKEFINILKNPIIFIFLICILVQLYLYKKIPDSVITNDSISYSYMYRGSIRNGTIDPIRTPVYPYIIKVIGYIGGQANLNNNIVIFQKLLFIITLIIFYCIIKELTKNKLIIYISTLIFGTLPQIVFWNVFILTESIALFEMTLLSYVTIKYLKKTNYLKIVLMRCINTMYDYDKTTVSVFTTNIFIVLDTKIVF